MSTVTIWWQILCAVSVINICVWVGYAVSAHRFSKLALWQLALSTAYVFGCAFRSFLPRTDVARFVLFDTWLSSVTIGRSVATVAEICFALQWAILLHVIAKKDGRRSFALVVSWLLVPVIVIAECCSWYAVLTTSYLGNVLEESLWTVSAVLIIASICTLWHRLHDRYPRVFASIAAAGIVYVLYMVTADVPVYFYRWLSQGALNGVYLPVAEGWHDAATRWVVTWRLSDWLWDIPWMTLYFSVGVWSSITLVHITWYETDRGKM